MRSDLVIIGVKRASSRARAWREGSRPCDEDRRALERASINHGLNVPGAALAFEEAHVLSLRRRKGCPEPFDSTIWMTSRRRFLRTCGFLGSDHVCEMLLDLCFLYLVSIKRRDSGMHISIHILHTPSFTF